MKFLLMICTAFALSIASQSVTADIVLQCDDFTNSDLAVGDGTSVNGGYQLVSNSTQGTGTVGESGSNATITTAADSFDNTGIVSLNSFSTLGLTSFSTTWVVDSQTGNLGTAGGSPNLNATEFLLQGGTSNGTGDGSGFRTPTYIQFVIDSNGNLDLNANDGAGVVALASNIDLGAIGGVQDGYALTLDVDATGWAVGGTGFAVNPSASGAWSGGFDFTDLQTNLYSAATIQSRANNLPIELNLDSIKVNGVTAVPEPSSLLLLAGVLGMFGVRRRRA